MNTRRKASAPALAGHYKTRLLGVALVTAVASGCGGGASPSEAEEQYSTDQQDVAIKATSGGNEGIYLTRGSGGAWQLRLRADGGWSNYSGSVVASHAFAGVTPVSVESDDLLDTSEPRRIAFQFNANKKWQDGVDFVVAPDAQACLSVTAPDAPKVYVDGAPMPASFSLTTLGPCDGALQGSPTYDGAAEAAMYLWQESDGAWRLRATGGGGTAMYLGSIASDQVYASVAPFSFESNDLLDTSDSRRIRYEMSANNQWQDGIDFAMAAGAGGCFDVSATPGVTVRIGSAAILMPPVFDMKTLGPCDAPQNSVPVANAGADQQVNVGTVVKLDGSASTDADGDALTYAWALTGKPSGSTTALANAGAVQPSFTPDVSGTYTLSLVVSDGTATSVADTVVITAVSPNSVPVANAGADGTVAIGTVSTVDGSGSKDADGDALTYAWTLVEKPSGSLAALSGANTARATFTPDLVGNYTLSLVVSDGKATSAADTVVINAEDPNQAPVANAGPDQAIVTLRTAALNGSASSDPDGDVLAYAWTLVSKPVGSVATLSGATTVQPSFVPDVDGSYTVSLVVYDGKLASTADTVVVNATNTAPVANAGADRSVDTGKSVTLDGTGSSDADGDSLVYAWTLADKPAASLATLSGTSTATPVFTPDVDGQYTVSLVVSDGKVNSAADTVVITAVTANSAPVADAGPDVTVDVGVKATVDGSGSTDADGDTLTYSWSLKGQPTGSAVILSGVNTAKASFTPDVAGDYLLQLAVNDGKLNSTADSVTVTAEAVVVPPADEPVTEPTKAGYAPLRVAFTDTFGNGVTANSDLDKQFWSVGTGSGITVQETNGNLVITSQAPSGNSGMIASKPGHRFNFFTQPLRFAFSGLALGGTTPNASERVAQFSLNSSRQGSYAAADSLQLRITGSRRLTLKWKTDTAQAEPSLTLLDTTLASLPTALLLSVDQTSYHLEAGGKVFSGQHSIPLAAWGMRGDSALVIEGIRARDALDGTTATVTLADVKADSLPLADFFRNGSVAANGHRSGFWMPVGTVTESGGRLQLTAASSTAPSAAVIGPVSKEFNFFARKLRFSGEVAFDAASVGDGANTTRFGLASTAETTYAAPDALGLVFSANKRVQLGIKANSRNRVPESGTVLLDKTLTFQPTSFDLALDRTQYQLDVYGSGGSVRYTGAHNMKWHDWGVAANVAVAIEAQRSASGTGKVNWTKVAAVDESAYYVAPTVFGPIGDGITLEKPELGDEQPLADWGLVDVTKAPFNADPTGQRDSTEALRHAMDFAREHYLATFLPSGTYTVSDTLECAQSLYYRTSTTTKLLNDEEGPCILMGSRAGSSRPKIVLAPRSAGFNDTAVRKPVVHLWARNYNGNPENPQPNISYNQMVRDLDFVIGEGNAGAVAIHHQAAQGSAVQDVTIDATHGFAGLDSGIGSGGLTANVTVIGGRYGLYLRTTQPTPTMVGITLIGQTVSAINYGGRQTLNAVGMKIVVPGIGPAIKVEGRSTQLGQVALIDSEITFERADSRNVAVNTDSAVYLKDVYVRNAATVVQAIDGGNLAGNATGWRYVKEYAHGVRPPLFCKNGSCWQYEVPVYVDGVRKTTDVVVLGSNGTPPPADLQSRHLWDDTFPHWQQSGVVNVMKAPYYAKGDGVADDTDAIQAAVDAGNLVFLPKGYYRVNRPIQLRAGTKLFGVAPNMSVLLGSDGTAFANGSAPQPVLRTVNDAAARTTVGFLSVFAPVDLDGVFGVHWRAGRNSIFRSVNVYRHSAFGFAARPGKPAPHTSTHPLTLISDNGGGRWFLYHQGTSFSMAPSYRHFKVDGTREPLRVYQLNPEHAKTDAGAEIRNAHNVDIYGFKAESNYVGMWVRDSDQVSIYGYGGNGAAFPYYDTYPSNFAQYTPSLFRIERTPNIRLAQLPDEPRVSGGDPVFGMGVDPSLWHMLLEVPASGGTILTNTLDRPVLYKRGNPNGSISFGGSTATDPSSTTIACGAPSYHAGTDATVLVWKECDGGVWSVRAVAGGGSATYTGSVSGSQALTGVTPFSIEAHDTLDYTTDPSRIAFGLTMWSPSEDGFDFSYPSGTSICVNVAEPAGTTVLVGPGRTPVTGPFNPETLAPCSL